MRKVNILTFPREKHEKIDSLMRELQIRRINEEILDTLIFVEHPEIVTIGPKAKKENILPPKEFKSKFVDRGGGITWHGPGQLIVYPIFKWDLKDEVNTQLIIKKLEQWVISAFRDLNIIGDVDERMRGVWVGGNKIVSIGLSFLKWVSRHGLSINYDTPEGRVELLQGCGLDSGITSSLSARGYNITRIDLERSLLNSIYILGREID